MRRRTRRRGMPIPAMLASLLLLAAAAPAAIGPLAGSEVFVQPAARGKCPCGGGQPPPLPCGASRDNPLACFEDAYARASNPGDTVTLLDGTFEACLDLARDGSEERPFTYRAAQPDGAVIHCPRDRDAIAITGRFNVLDGIRIVSETIRNSGVRIGGPSGAEAGRNTLRRVSVQGHQAGVTLEGRGDNRLEGVVVRSSWLGLELKSPSNAIRDLDVRDAKAHGVWIKPGAAGNAFAGGRIEDSGASGVFIDDGAADTMLEGVVVLGTRDMAVNVRASRVTLRGCEIGRAGTHGVEVYPLPVPVESLRIEGCDIHDDSGLVNGIAIGDGIKLVSVRNAVITASHIHHNSGNGIFDLGWNTTIENCEIDHNGHGRLAHGLYTKAAGGVIRGCRVHDNAGFGLHLWAAPVRYLAEDNEVYANGQVRGGGIVVGGTYKEAPSGGTGYPEQVVVRHNHVWGNIGPAMYYLIGPRDPKGGCQEGAGGNAFLDNLVETGAEWAGITVQGVPENCIRNEGNEVRIVGIPRSP